MLRCNMPPDYLHQHPDFSDLLRIVGQEQSLDPSLVEKDYWVMHCLYGLQKMGLSFELKGGTSLSKGFGIIDRFSEDIDLRIDPPAERKVKTGRNQDKPAHCESRKHFYDWLAETITIDGIVTVSRDEAFRVENSLIKATIYSGTFALGYHVVWPLLLNLNQHANSPFDLKPFFLSNRQKDMVLFDNCRLTVYDKE